jgi:hypothetical protein
MEEISKLEYDNIPIDWILANNDYSYAYLPSLINQTEGFMSDISQTYNGKIRTMAMRTAERYSMMIKTPIIFILTIAVIMTVLLIELILLYPNRWILWITMIIIATLMIIVGMEIILRFIN